nr:tryptophan synthase subunit alpha [Desulfobulbaceae bacterium]
MHLRDSITNSLKQKEILLMTHIVLGYPSFEDNRRVVEQMVANGVDLIEMQIPFSEPVADGPVIIKANQDSLTSGTKVKDCLDFAREMCAQHPIPFLFMTYYNIVFKYGLKRFLSKAEQIGIKGLIIPDLPPEEGQEYLSLAKEHSISAIQIFAPTSTEERMQTLSSHADGFIYCVARRGVTGSQTSFDKEFNNYIDRCKANTELPLAVGFGISDKNDVEELRGKAEIAVIGSATIRLVDSEGPEAVGPFIKGLR